MLLMLVAGIPMYICATSSTPIAAAMILKGVSPGAALVFLLAGPATNITSLTVLLGLLGKRATAIYLAAVAGVGVLSGLALDRIYLGLGISAQAALGQATEFIPPWIRLGGAVLLLALSVRPVLGSAKRLFGRFGRKTGAADSRGPDAENCGCHTGCGCGH